MEVHCEDCGEDVRPKQQLLTCCTCQKNYHRICTGLKQSEYRSMVKAKTVDKWFCSVCKVALIVDASVTEMDTESCESVQSIESVQAVVSESNANTVGTMSNVPSTLAAQVTSTSVASEVPSGLSTSCSLPCATSSSSSSTSSNTQNVPSLSTSGEHKKTSNSEARSKLAASNAMQIEVSVTTGSRTVTSCPTKKQRGTSSTPGVQSMVSSGVSSVQSVLSNTNSVPSVVSSGVSSMSSVVSSTTDVLGMVSSGLTSVMSSTTNVQSAPLPNIPTTLSTIGHPNRVNASKPAEYFNNFVNRVNGLLSKVNQTKQKLNDLEEKTTKRVAPSAKSVAVENSSNVIDVAVEKVSGVQYSCCDIHGTLKKKANEDTVAPVKLKSTPSMEKIVDLIPPRILYRSTAPSVRTTLEFDFSLTRDQSAMIKNAIQSKKFDVQALIRFCLLDVKTVQDEYKPDGSLMVNDRYILLNSVTYIGAKQQPKQEPVDITHMLRLDSKNEIKLKYFGTKSFYMTCELVKKRTVEDMVGLLTLCHPQHTEDLVKEKFKGDEDCDIATTNLKVSLICPIGKMRLVKPCRSKHCTHLQCIDARTLVGMNQTKTTWKCPICQNPAEFEDLALDGLFMDILKSVPWDIVEVEFLKDGSWTHKKTSKDKSADNEPDKENVCNLLDETIDKLDVIDLTETDDECTPVKKKPLQTSSLLVNQIANPLKEKLEAFARHVERRLGSQGSTSSQSSVRTVSSSSVDSTSDRSFSSCHGSSSPVFNSAYRGDNSSYGRHRSNKRNKHHSRPYESSSRRYNGNDFSSENYRQTTMNNYWQNANYGNNFYNVRYSGQFSNYYQNSSDNRFGQYIQRF